MVNVFKEYFSKLGGKFCNHLYDHVRALMINGSANTYAIARELGVLNKKSFKTNEMATYRFLQDRKFQIDDTFWRCHINMIFDMLETSGVIKKGDMIQINVDFTTHEDNFLILAASVMLQEKALIIYFTSRVYPKKKNQMSYKKMEEAFIKGLRHALSKKYRYVIVADRGFGNRRFAKICKENAFDYVLRINSNLNIKKEEELQNNLCEEGRGAFEARVASWKEDHNFTVAVNEEGDKWFLFSNNKELDAKVLYDKRFKIEKNFQDCKSGGYNVEKNKIRKYDRFKRLMYLVFISHAITSIIGYIIANTLNRIKKNFSGKEDLKLKLILAFFELDTKPCAYTISNPLNCMKDGLCQD